MTSPVRPDPARLDPMEPSSGPVDPAWSVFQDSEYLRRTLIRICSVEDGWRTDPEADDLVCFAADRFAQLAVKHGLEAADAMSAAFEAMRHPSVRYGQDPWGVIVTAVATTLRAWQFADEALTGIDTARRGGLTGCRAERFSERDLPRWEHDPNLAVGFNDTLDQPDPTGPSLHEQADDIAALFHLCGWPAEQTRIGVEVVLRKLADTGSRPAAYEALRRNRQWRAVTGLPAGAWTALLRLLLGSPNPGAAHTRKGRGILLLLALGETTADLAGDTDLATTIRATAPARGSRR